MKGKFRIALLSDDRKMSEPLILLLESREYCVVLRTDFSRVLGALYSDPPDMIIIDLGAFTPERLKIVSELKTDSYFAIIPMIGFIRPSIEESVAWEQLPLDDYMVLPVQTPELFSRIALSIQRMERIFDHNPLTKLPGNTSIRRAVEKSMGKPRAVCYVDINLFKPYNDIYGFVRGDEVIRMLARIISNAVKESKEGGFSGHIGGDDFVFIVSGKEAEAVSQLVIDRFSMIVVNLFDKEAQARGYYISKDRQGRRQRIPLLGIAIAIVPTSNTAIQHYGEVAARAAELKKEAKASKASCYVIDCRKA